MVRLNPLPPRLAPPSRSARCWAPSLKAKAALLPPSPRPPAPKAAPPKSAAPPPPVAASKADAPAMPSAQRIAAETGLATSSVAGTGKDGRVTKGDMLGALAACASAPVAVAAAPAGPRQQADREERVPMTRLRKTIALRLKESQ